MKRKGISKSVRFAIFSRDGYTCRYCGRQADQCVLVIDHVIPVAQDGTNDPENLITSCKDCNAGKGAKTPAQAAPTEADRLRLAQERNEQLRAAESAREAVAARQVFRGTVINLWFDIRGTDEVHKGTINTIIRYAEEHGVEVVAEWIQIAEDRFPHYPDWRIGTYISGIRRRVLAEQEERAANAELLAQETAVADPFKDILGDYFSPEAKRERERYAEAERARLAELETERRAEYEAEARRTRELIQEQERSLRRRVLGDERGDPEAWEADG